MQLANSDASSEQGIERRTAKAIMCAHIPRPLSAGKLRKSYRCLICLFSVQPLNEIPWIVQSKIFVDLLILLLRPAVTSWFVVLS
jgi:hypothetical protein